MIYGRRKHVAAAVSWISLVALIGTLFPADARAQTGGLTSAPSITVASVATSTPFDGTLSPLSKRDLAEGAVITPSSNVQNMDLPSPAASIATSSISDDDVSIVDNTAVAAQDGPMGTIADIEKSGVHGTISIHTVSSTDTLSSIAALYDIPVNTILWANDLTVKSIIRPGDKLVILPVAGVRHTVKSGDTLASLAQKYGASEADINGYNGIDTLTIGTEIIIPNGEIAVSAPAPATKPKATATAKAGVSGGSSSVNNGYYTAPLPAGSYKRTQGIHGSNGVDLGAPEGTPIYASAPGTVVVAKGSGWNGGYGDYVVISHSNGSQTLYAHMSSVSVSVGETVGRGETIGSVGHTGQVSGPTGNHVHFEIRNGIRNPF